MRRFLVIGALAAALAAVPATHTVQADEGGNGANHYCTWFENTFPGFFDLVYGSHGACVSSIRKEINRSFPAKFCQDHWEHPWLPFFRFPEFKNQGDCVSWFRTR